MQIYVYIVVEEWGCIFCDVTFGSLTELPDRKSFYILQICVTTLEFNHHHH